MAYMCVYQTAICWSGTLNFNSCRAKVDNATQTDVTGLKWFKIYEDGLTASDQTWGVDRLIANKGMSTLYFVVHYDIIAFYIAL